jgi:hypothetical protein
VEGREVGHLRDVGHYGAARGSAGGAAIVRRYSWRSASIGLMRDAWNAGT